MERDADRHHERALSHPRRVAILDYLAGVDLASGQQVAEALGLTPATAAYHLCVLHDADLLEQVGTMFERGAAQSFYATATR